MPKNQTEDPASEFDRLTREMGEAMRPLVVRGRAELFQLDQEVRAMHKIPKKARPRCGAATRAGKTCQAPAVHGGDRCRLHGGVPYSLGTVYRDELAYQRRELLVLVKVAEALT